MNNGEPNAKPICRNIIQRYIKLPKFRKGFVLVPIEIVALLKGRDAHPPVMLSYEEPCRGHYKMIKLHNGVVTTTLTA